MFKNKIYKNLIITIIQYNKGHEKRIKRIEYLRALYRYPKKMQGRVIPKTTTGKTDVLVFAAHPDDDVLGLGTTLYRHSKNGDNIKVVFTTNGTGRDGESWHVKKHVSKDKSEVRFREAVQALSLINIPEENIFCLGFPDGGTQRYLKTMTEDILALIQELNPGRIYTHCIEGGHDDHDMTGLAVKYICKKMDYSNLYEWTEYNSVQPLGTHDISFLPSESNKMQEIKIDISEEERKMKKKMLACHDSQDVEQFYMMGEAIRQADISNLENEIYEHIQLQRSRLLPMVKKFIHSKVRIKPNANFEITSD